MLIKKIILMCFILLLFPFHLYSACTGSSPTWTTDGNESADVAECITAATAGDTINVIAGDGEATWAEGAIVIPSAKPLQIMGPGRDNLKIILGGNYPLNISTDGATPYIGTALLPATRVSGFTFETPSNIGYAAILARGQGWRIDHCRYSYIRTTTAQTAAFVNAYALNQTAGTISTGLIDNNIINNGHIDSGMLGSFTILSTPWAEALDLGTANSVYVEDNVFNAVNTSYQMYLDSNGSGKYVARYNTFNDGRNLVHSLQDDWRGSISWEIYGNSFNAISNNVGIAPLAGTGVVFNNYMSGSGGSKGISFDIDRVWSSRGTYALRCDGTSYYDGNTEVSPAAPGYPCRDQLGRSTDTTLWTGADAYHGNTPAPSQALNPAYLWSNYNVTTPIVPNVGAEAINYIRSDRDYYKQSAGAFDGTTGVGCGTDHTTIGKCTVGTAYWETSQSCSSISTYVGASTEVTGGERDPAVKIEGTLYKCTADNTWTAYYTPYTYPHPLRGETDSTAPTNTQAGNSINAAGDELTLLYSESVVKTGAGTVSLTCSGGAVTPTYSSGSGTATHKYTLGRVINQAEVCTVDYTQTGNDLEDAAGNDLATYTGHTIVNGSTVSAGGTTYDLTVAVVGGGTVSSSQGGIGCTRDNTPCTKTVDDGTVITFTLVPYPGHNEGVITNTTGTGCGKTTTMSEARSCTVTFPPIYLLN